MADVQVDNAVPFGVAVTAPASPLRGAVTLTATADDDDSGVATVTLQRRTGAGAFVDICTTSADPFSCTLVTTAGATPDGTYDLRAIAVDAAGNTTTSSTVSRQIDNSQPSVSLVDPGAYLRGTVTLTANAFTGSGVTSVAIQRAPADGTTFTTDLHATTSTPFTCSWDTTAVADGLYDLRAVMTYASGQTLTSADRQPTAASTTPPSAATTCRPRTAPAARAGRAEAGDVVVLTWTRPMNTATLLAGLERHRCREPRRPARRRLASRASAPVAPPTDCSCSTAAGGASGLGSVNLKANFIKSKKTTAFAATATQSTVAIGGIDRTVDADHARRGHQRRRQRPHRERDPVHGLDAERHGARPR